MHPKRHDVLAARDPLADAQRYLPALRLIASSMSNRECRDAIGALVDTVDERKLAAV